MTTKIRLEEIEGLPKYAERTILEAEGSELVDVLGTLNSVEQRLGALRREHSSEIDDGEVGEIWRAEVGRSAARSFNFDNLMRLFQENGVTIMDLVNAGVVEVRWKWTALKNFAKLRGLKLNVVKHEVPALGKSEGDVGEYWHKAKYPKWTAR